MDALHRGYAVVSINYRLSGDAKFPSQIYDLKAAIRWVRANSGQYALNPKKIAVWGDSAGGYLASLAGTSSNTKALEDKSMGNPDQPSNVSAVVDWYGPIDFLALGDTARLDKVVNKLMGRTKNEAPESYSAANPETYINPENPPFFIQHGDADQVIPVQQSIDFAAKLQNVVGTKRVVFEPIKGADHLDEAFNTPENINKVLNFLDRFMK
jgi:acetyl esterase/lipase